jgi:predicted AAA+ superfamily ATPase
MIIERNTYLQKLIERMGNGSIKVITGIRRCGKSFLLFELFHKYLRSLGIDDDHVTRIALDDEEHESLLDAKALSAYVRGRIVDSAIHYVFLDEIQEVKGFEKVLNGLNRLSNLDIFVTGSNSKFLSSDILTEFRGRGDEVRVFPLSFSEFLPAHGGSLRDAWRDYYTYGGFPLILSRKTDELKSKYLMDLFSKVYLDDITERNGIRNDAVMESVVRVLASSVGSLTNPSKLSKTFKSTGMGNVSDKTISSYINYLREAFLIERSYRYDVKGRKYISTPIKYYFTDVGLRNALLNFRQQEENHIMENSIFNELVARGFNVDVGVVEHSVKNEWGNSVRKQLEIDFVCNKGDKRYYVQSAFSIPDSEKMEQEQQSLVRIGDSFQKIIAVRDDIKPWRNDKGISILGIRDFLLNADSLDR